VINLAEKYQALSLRERILVVGAAVALIWMMWAYLISDILVSRMNGVTKDIRTLTSQMVTEAQSQEAMRRQKSNSPDKKLANERDLLSIQIGKMDSVLGESLSRFVSPENMPVLLEDVISRHRSLTLTRIVSLPVEKIEVAITAEGVSGVSIYRHPMRIEFEGGYFQTLAYLQELEQSEWKFTWRDFEYQVAEFPTGVAVLQLETLSRERGWIGV